MWFGDGCRYLGPSNGGGPHLDQCPRRTGWATWDKFQVSKKINLGQNPHPMLFANTTKPQLRFRRDLSQGRIHTLHMVGRRASIATNYLSRFPAIPAVFIVGDRSFTPYILPERRGLQKSRAKPFHNCQSLIGRDEGVIPIGQRLEHVTGKSLSVAVHILSKQLSVCHSVQQKKGDILTVTDIPRTENYLFFIVVFFHQ